ncbi:hypothetical protein BY996DRAFT_7394805 [Phakopsora pachyrhizi]|nr:hypothetical protein BY996DRAFT_7394805 [Phakopsora pachyrhizi]
MNLSFNKNLNAFIVVCTVLYISTTLGGYRSLEDFGDLSRGLAESSDAGSSQAKSNPSIFSRFGSVASLLGRAPSRTGEASRGAIKTVRNLNRKIRSLVTSDLAADQRKNLISERVDEIEKLYYVPNGNEVDQRRTNAESARLREDVVPDLFRLIEKQVNIMPKNIEDNLIGDIISTLHEIMRDNHTPDPEFTVKASKTFQLYAQDILSNTNSKIEDNRTRLLIDLMRIYCAIFGHEGTNILTENNETIIFLAKGIQSIIKGLFDRGEIHNIGKLELYKEIFVSSQAHPLTFIFKHLGTVGNENKWDSLLQEYINLEFKDLNNQDLNGLLKNYLIIQKSNEKVEENQKLIRYDLLNNLLLVGTLPTLSKISINPGEVRVYFSLFWLWKYLTGEKNIGGEFVLKRKTSELYAFLEGFIELYSDNKDNAADYFLLNHMATSDEEEEKSSIYNLRIDYIKAFKS